jgi:hypothetical protein
MNDDIDAGSPAADGALPVGAPVRVARLDDLKAIRGEAGRLYREARRRHGRYPDALTAQRLANVLGNVRTLIEVADLSDRLDAIERKLAT